MARVYLGELETVAGILIASTGVTYVNQAGGTACMQPEAEGALFPVDIRSTGAGTSAVTLLDRLTALFVEEERVDEGMADAVDQVLAAFYATRGMRVDRHRLADSIEAWIYVVLDEVENGACSEVGRAAAVLTWPNSD